MPTTSPASLIAVAAEALSPESAGKACALSLSQSTAMNPRSCFPAQVGSRSAVSAQPTICPAAFAPAAYPLFPPSVGSAVITPSRQANPTQVWPVVGMNAAQLHDSPSGSGLDVSEIPTTARAAWLGQATALLTAGPPSAPRSRLWPPRHNAACTTRSPGSVDRPLIEPAASMLLAPAALPPSDRRVMTE